MPWIKKSQLVRWHTYVGLFTFFYIIAFGFSSLVLNHGVEFDRGKLVDEWDALADIDTSASNRIFGEALRDQLNLMGWPINWKAKKTDNQFFIPITNPGKEYELFYNFQTGSVHVKEYRKSFWSVLNTMHFFGGKIPNASVFIKSFRVYQYVGMLFLFISLVLGLWLWLRHSIKRWELLFFGGITIFSIIIMWLI